MSSTTSAKTPNQQHRKRWSFLPLGGVVLLMFLWNWQRIINRSPLISVPTPVMPKSNAYDTFLHANRVMQATSELDRIVFNGLGSRNWKAASLPMRQAVLNRNTEALALIRTGLRQTYRQPPVRSIHDTFPSVKFRQLARLLALDVDVRAESGDWGGAMNSRLDQIEFSEDLYQGAGTMGLLVGAACQKTQLPFYGDITSHLNLEQTEFAVKRLEGILSRRCPLSSMLTEEKWAGVTSLDALFRDEKWQDEVSQQQSYLSSASPGMNQIQIKAKVMMVDKRVVLRNYIHFMDQCAANARVPLYRRTPFPQPPSDPINQLFDADFRGVEQIDAQEESAVQLLLLRLALHAYRLKHSRYPQKLSDLIPAYIRRIPNNPLGAGGQFSYQDTGDTYLLFNASLPASAATKPPANRGYISDPYR